MSTTPKPALYLTADELNGQHIDSVVEFTWYGNMPLGRHIKHLVSGVLRQVYHVSGYTTLSLASSDNGDIEEFNLSEDEGITVNP